MSYSCVRTWLSPVRLISMNFYLRLAMRAIFVFTSLHLYVFASLYTYIYIQYCIYMPLALWLFPQWQSEFTQAAGLREADGTRALRSHTLDMYHCHHFALHSSLTSSHLPVQVPIIDILHHQVHPPILLQCATFGSTWSREFDGIANGIGKRQGGAAYRLGVTLYTFLSYAVRSRTSA